MTEALLRHAVMRARHLRNEPTPPKRPVLTIVREEPKEEPSQNEPSADDLIAEWVKRQIEKHNLVPPPEAVGRIQQACCHYFGVRRSAYLSERKTDHLCYARQVGMYLTKKRLGRSLPEVGRRFGGRDHSTAHHGIAKIQGLIDAGHAQTIADIQAIEAML
jgi:chromosomal replication initiation ATPase DnaA